MAGVFETSCDFNAAQKQRKPVVIDYPEEEDKLGMNVLWKTVYVYWVSSLYSW